MATKKFAWVLFGILVISTWVLGSANQATAETLNFRTYTYVTKQEVIPIGDVEGHSLIFGVRGGFYVFENGEVATCYIVGQVDDIKGAGSVMLYHTLTFTDGSTIILKTQGTTGGGGPASPASGAFRSEIIKGTGRFEGIKGTSSIKSKFIPAEKGELGPKTLGEGTINYTRPSK